MEGRKRGAENVLTNRCARYFAIFTVDILLVIAASVVIALLALRIKHYDPAECVSPPPPPPFFALEQSFILPCPPQV